MADTPFVNPFKRLPVLRDRDILELRSSKNVLDPTRPYLYFTEPELSDLGKVEPVATVFLTNRECPFRCLMCDLWKNTLDEPTPKGAIPQQIEFALKRIPSARVIKLYNSGNFFDAKAIPPADWPRIANLLQGFRRVVVENHPRLCGDACLHFRDLIEGQLEVAMGLETIHPDVLPRLNKQMTTQDFATAARFLGDHDIAVRTFVLLRPPGLSDAQGVMWAVKSLQFAFDHGVGCCALVPTRGGNGAMERLQKDGLFEPPSLEAMEEALEQGLALRRGRVFMDLWDASQFGRCQQCVSSRVVRLEKMNHTQTVLPRIACSACGSAA